MKLLSAGPFTTLNPGSGLLTVQSWGVGPGAIRENCQGTWDEC